MAITDQTKRIGIKSVQLIMVLIVFLIFRVGNRGYVDKEEGQGTGDSLTGLAEMLPWTYPFNPTTKEWYKGWVDTMLFGIMVSLGYLYLVLVQLVGLALGETTPPRMALIFNVCGFLFYLVIGSITVNFYSNSQFKLVAKGVYSDSGALVMGSMAILTSFAFLAEAVIYREEAAR